VPAQEKQNRKIFEQLNIINRLSS